MYYLYLCCLTRINPAIMKVINVCHQNTKTLNPTKKFSAIWCFSALVAKKIAFVNL